MSPGSATPRSWVLTAIIHKCNLPSAGCVPAMLGWRDASSHSAGTGSQGKWGGREPHLIITSILQMRTLGFRGPKHQPPQGQAAADRVCLIPLIRTPYT